MLGQLGGGAVVKQQVMFALVGAKGVQSLQPHEAIDRPQVVAELGQGTLGPLVGADTLTRP